MDARRKGDVIVEHLWRMQLENPLVVLECSEVRTAGHFGSIERASLWELRFAVWGERAFALCTEVRQFGCRASL